MLIQPRQRTPRQSPDLPRRRSGAQVLIDICSIAHPRESDDNTHMNTPILTNPNSREILEGSLEISPDTDALHDAIRAVLQLRGTDFGPSVEQVIRVVRHLREDDFDYMSTDADDAAIELEAYRETLYLENN